MLKQARGSNWGAFQDPGSMRAHRDSYVITRKLFLEELACPSGSPCFLFPYHER